MARFTVEEAEKLMMDRKYVRNLGIIAHIDHGKSTLADSLLAASGLVKDDIAGRARATDTREDEQERGITIKTTGISLHHIYKGGNKIPEGNYLINLQDTPGHVDFSGEVTAALRVVDGALVVVDAVESVMVQTETVVSQALQEHVRPVLYINKVDRLITEMRLKPEDAYEQFKKIIDQFNTLIQTYAPTEFKKEWQVDPLKGSVCFGSAMHRFGLSIPALAEIWSKQLNKPVDVLIPFLWQKTNFVKGVLGPIYDIYQKTEEGKTDELKAVVEKLKLKVPDETWIKNPKQIAKTILEQWQPVEKAVLDMAVKFCPSPIKAQKNIEDNGSGRMKGAWDGDFESDLGKSMLTCDENGPLMISLSKMFLQRAKRVVAIGRIFSGSIKQGDKVTVFLPGYNPNNPKERNFTTNVQQVSILMGKDAEPVGKVIAGNIVALVGLRGAVSSATVSSEETLIPFKSLTFAVEPVVTIALETKNPKELPKLVEGMKLIELVDPSLKTKIDEETGEYLLSGTGELHLEIAIKDLQDMQKLDVKQSEPIITFRESCEGTSPKPALAKSPNKHNRLFVTAKVLEEGIIDAIENKMITPYTDSKKVAAILRDEGGWETQISRKLWGMGGAGGADDGPNVFVDGTKGVQYLREVKDYIVQGMRWATSEGPIMGEPMFGVRFDINDCSLHEDPIHRGIGQMMGVGRNSSFGALLSAQPIIKEPIYKIQITVPEKHLGAVYKVLSKRRGKINETIQKEGTPMNIISGEIPVSESLGINTELRSETSGFAFSQLIFSHYERVPGNLYKLEEEGGGLARKFVEQVRKRKGYTKIAPPPAEDYIDRM
ncbi:MAG: Elongation factor 2 [Candidatus Heimdallarchaeota archaeon LC_3]|uniref:Elongation factor 2 n=2 Tax=unclassified sequences TaxID=12908 RepID=A0A0F6PYQ2_9ZZZZ|nr:putative elongation factor 2 [uncultured organism]OLS27505.1 MAG: Elongation factor 2 [Candidatus Heimdallarchaeota archaeon LC_3]